MVYFMQQGERGKYVVELENIKKAYYYDEIKFWALRGVNLKVKRGEVLSIQGPSGSGKSTLLNIIGAIDKPTEGRVLVDGVDITKLPSDELARFRNEKIGFVFQFYNLIPRMSVLRNVELPLLVKNIPKKERIKRVLKMLEIVGLEDKAYRTPNKLSGGEQQRVAIARALINNPSVILADEPTGNLDTETGKSIINLFLELRKEFNTTVIIVTHDPIVAKRGDRIIYLRDGRIVLGLK